MEDKYDQREELEKMNRQLTEQEQLLDAAFGRLGKAYYSKYQNNPEDWARDEVATIREVEKSLTEIKERICELKGIRLCPSCGQEVPLDGVFCSNCGTVLQTKKNPEMSDDMLTCKQCGSAILTGQKFCIRCGARIDQPQTNATLKMHQKETMTPEVGIASRTSIGENVSAPLELALSKNMCPNCKKVFPDDMKFCTSCGTKLIRS